MDDITGQVAGLSVGAKAWTPGQGFVPTSKAATSTSIYTDYDREATASSHSSSTAKINIGESAWKETTSNQGISVNGTHYFGQSRSWEGQYASQHHDVSQRHGRATVPNHHHEGRSGRSSTLHTTLSLPVEEYHHYSELSHASHREMEPSDPRHKAVPSTFTRAYCLDYNQQTNKQTGEIIQQRSSFGYPQTVFRVTSTSYGKLYCLRRMDSVRCVSHKIIQSVMHQWLSNSNGREGAQPQATPVTGGFDHPGIVRWYKCFIYERALFFIHQYHAGAFTLQERFFAEGAVPLPENMIWSCFVQLVSAVRAVHSNNLAVRTLQLNHILCTQENITSTSVGLPKLRLRINCTGVIDILEYEARKGVEELQRADMRALGCILLSLTTGHVVNVNDIYNVNQTQQQQGAVLMEYFTFVQQNYSREMYVLLHSLLQPNANPPSIQNVVSSLASRVLDELDGAHSCIDTMHSSLCGIYESGRALRLLLKLAFVNERPEFGIDKSWSESGDCYILKLFRDFVFAQCDEGGRPVMDVGHVISSLNKLDVADEEKIVLASRDGKNVLVVSFADVAWCLEKSYQELCSSSVPVPTIT